MPGEGRWAAGRVGPGGALAIFTTFEGPDAHHPIVVAGVARIDMTTLTDTLVQAGGRGLQLDIHTEMVDFLAYPVGADHAPYGVKLLPDRQAARIATSCPTGP